MIKNIFFDFDGVIAESVNVKTEAFRSLYLPFGEEIASKAVKHHKDNGGMSRFEKFRLYHKDFLGETINDTKVNELADEFSKLVKQGVIDSQEVPGSHEFIKRNYGKYKMFVITGTPTEESKQICKARGIYNYFDGIYGSPEKKDYWCDYILKNNKLKFEETIFVGDALADYNAAVKNDLRFYLREYEENYELFKNINNIYRFKDFTEFEKIINE